MSNLKHYVANEQELDRQLSSSNVAERDAAGDLRAAVRDRAQPQQPGEHHVLLQPDQRRLRVREPAPERRPQRRPRVRRLRHVGLRGGALDRAVVGQRARPGTESTALLHPGAARCGAGRRRDHAAADRRRRRPRRDRLHPGRPVRPPAAGDRRSRCLHGRAQGDRPEGRRTGHRTAEERRTAAAQRQAAAQDRPVRPDGVEHTHQRHQRVVRLQHAVAVRKSHHLDL